MSNYELAKIAKHQLEDEYNAACNALKLIPGVGTGPLGLTPDEVRATECYQLAKARMDRAFAALRTFNTQFTKRYAKEYAAERNQRRNAA